MQIRRDLVAFDGADSLTHTPEDADNYAALFRGHIPSYVQSSIFECLICHCNVIVHFGCI